MKATDMRGPDIGLWFNRGNRDRLVISDVSSRGPITRLGFHEGDRIVSVNGHRVAAEAEFINYLLNSNAERVEVVVNRDGRDETIYVEPAALTQDYGTTQVDPIEQFGVVLDDRYDDRIVIWRVIPRSPAYYAGLREGDVISTLSGRPYTTRRDFEASIGDLKAGETNLQVRRGGRNRDLTVDVPEYQSVEQEVNRGEEQGVRDQGGQSANRDRSGAGRSGNDSQNDRNGTDRNIGPPARTQGVPNQSNQPATTGADTRGERR
jgi:S1-C subfamily serine protease